MPYNIDLEDRIDRLSTRLSDLTKKKMFGGVGYMLNGNMCFGIDVPPIKSANAS